MRSKTSQVERVGWHDIVEFNGELAMLCKTTKPEYADSVSINSDTFNYCVSRGIEYVLLQGPKKNVVLDIEDFKKLIENRSTFTARGGDEIWVFNWSEFGDKYAPEYDWDVYEPPNRVDQAKLQPKPQSNEPQLRQPEEGWSVTIGDSCFPEEYLEKELGLGLRNSKMQTVITALRSRRCNLTVDTQTNRLVWRFY